MASCKICYENFSIKQPERIPRLLDCKHGYCTECLMKLGDVHGKLIECPQCFYLTKVPAKGIDYLEKDDEILRKQFALSSIKKCQHCKKLSFPARKASLYCKNCNDYFCGACSDAVHMKLEFMSHTVNLATNPMAGNFKKERLVKSAPVKTLEERTALKSSKEGVNHIDNEEKRRCYSCMSNLRKGIPPELEERERETFTKLHEKMNQCIDEYSHDQRNLLLSMEKLKTCCKNVQQMIWQHFQSLRKVIDETEENLSQGISDICTSRLNAMDAQNMIMLDRIADAKLLGQKCSLAHDEVIEELLLQKEQLQENIDVTTEQLTSKMTSHKDEIYVQFPEWESLMHRLRKSAYIVEAANPPSNFKCYLQQNGDVVLTWDVPKNMRFIYPVSLFAIYASIGVNESFVLLEKVKKTSYIIPCSHASFQGKTFAQFKLSSINVIGESETTYPIGLKLMKIG